MIKFSAFLVMSLASVNIMAASYFCEGKIKSDTGSIKFVNIILSHITNESVEMRLQQGSITLENQTMFPTAGMFVYSAPLDEFGSAVKLGLKKNFEAEMSSMQTARVHYAYDNFNSNHELKSSASGWLVCRN